MNDPIPAVREDEATGETAALFADMRATLGVPFVNLIWRHLATLPGMLAWTWSVVQPMHGTQALQDAAAALRGGVKPPHGIQQPGWVFEAARVTAAERRVIGAMLTDYTAANTVNLLCLLLVQALLTGEAPGGRARVAAARLLPGSVTPDALPRLPGLAELSPSLRDLVRDLDGFGRLEDTDAVASLYRHLAHWPGFLAIVRAALSIPHATGALRQAHEQTRAHAMALMRCHLLPVASKPPAAPEAGRAAAEAAMGTFTGQMIARMVAMGEIMLAVLPAA